MTLSPAVCTALTGYDWPGNIRELRTVIERGALLTSGGEVQLADLSFTMGAAQAPSFQAGGDVTLEALEAEHIRRVVMAKGSLELAAATLGIDPSTLYRKRKRAGF